MDAAKNIDDVLGQAFHHVGHGLAGSLRIGGNRLTDWRAQEYE
jgi:hypothetical protein